jgi:hypothetical protein
MRAIEVSKLFKQILLNFNFGLLLRCRIWLSLLIVRKEKLGEAYLVHILVFDRVFMVLSDARIATCIKIIVYRLRFLLLCVERIQRNVYTQVHS